MERHLPYGIVT